MLFLSSDWISTLRNKKWQSLQAVYYKDRLISSVCSDTTANNRGHHIFWSLLSRGSVSLWSLPLGGLISLSLSPTTCHIHTLKMPCSISDPHFSRRTWAMHLVRIQEIQNRLDFIPFVMYIYYNFPYSIIIIHTFYGCFDILCLNSGFKLEILSNDG